ncbi:calcium-binding protein [Sphingomonas solaris]|uniref:Calcium-binding protein n=1 Tax=Alterirhizorhabdus solaris TaxID=2529389 RepID=A0A558QS32_9SPHN|nr:calcium-binding protein [Sphingomonas solaris]TVV69953.1 calcium-binding protein [Sphingomonas solaris]
MVIIGTDNGETLNGTPEDDTIIGNDGEDVINGLGGNDTIDSVDRPTNIFAGSVDPKRDVVDAGEGNDTVTGGRLDQLQGGAGTDTLLLNFNFNGPVAGSATPINLIFDAAGTGTASDGTSISGFERLILNLSDTGDNNVDTGNVEASITSGNGNDTLTTGIGNDILFGGGGNDILTAGGGNNQISGGTGDDIITAGSGDDSVGVAIATDGADRVNLGAGNDTVRFDRFDGGTGNIRLTFTSAEVGNSAAFDGGTLANQDGGLAVRVQAEDANDNLTGPISRYDDEGVTFIAGTQGITFDVRDLVSGTARGDTFTGVVLGTSAADDLSFFPPFRALESFYYNAGQGNDRIVAGDAADFLVGGAGNDILIGNGGNDRFIGGAGVDRYVYEASASTGRDTIIDFGKNDLLVVDTALRDFNRDGIITFGRNSVLDIDGTRGPDTVTFTGLDPQAGIRYLGSNAEGFLYADATVRPDGAIEGRLGNDALRGDANDAVADTFFFDTALGLGFGNDSIVNFGAGDRIVTTTAIRDSNDDGRVTFGGNDLLDLSDGTSINVNDRAPTTLMFDGASITNGVTYYTYSLDPTSDAFSALG